MFVSGNKFLLCMSGFVVRHGDESGKLGRNNPRFGWTVARLHSKMRILLAYMDNSCNSYCRQHTLIIHGLTDFSTGRLFLILLSVFVFLYKLEDRDLSYS